MTTPWAEFIYSSAWALTNKTQVVGCKRKQLAILFFIVSWMSWLLILLNFCDYVYERIVFWVISMWERKTYTYNEKYISIFIYISRLVYIDIQVNFLEVSETN